MYILPLLSSSWPRRQNLYFCRKVSMRNYQLFEWRNGVKYLNILFYLSVKCITGQPITALSTVVFTIDVDSIDVDSNNTFFCLSIFLHWCIFLYRIGYINLYIYIYIYAEMFSIIIIPINIFTDNSFSLTYCSFAGIGQSSSEHESLPKQPCALLIIHSRACALIVAIVTSHSILQWHLWCNDFRVCSDICNCNDVRN